MKHGWIEAAYSQKPSLASEVLEKCVRFDLEKKRDHSNAIDRLTQESTLATGTSNLLRDLLEELPNSTPSLLRQMLYSLIKQSEDDEILNKLVSCLLYTSPSPRDLSTSRMPSSA